MTTIVNTTMEDQATPAGGGVRRIAETVTALSCDGKEPTKFAEHRLWPWTAPDEKKPPSTDLVEQSGLKKDKVLLFLQGRDKDFGIRSEKRISPAPPYDLGPHGRNSLPGIGGGQVHLPLSLSDYTLTLIISGASPISRHFSSHLDRPREDISQPGALSLCTAS